jgi:hypothetical protein
MAYVTDEQLFPKPREPRAFWERTGLSPRQERGLNRGLAALVVLFVAGWVYSAVLAAEYGEGPQVARRLASGPLTPDAAPDVAFLMDAAMQRFINWDEIRGASGEVRVVVREPGDTLMLPDAMPAEVELVYGTDTLPRPDALPAEPTGPDRGLVRVPERAGIWNVLMRTHGAVRSVPNLNVVTLVPATEMRAGRIGDYRIGEWPRGGTGAYAAPRGFVQVTRENMNTYVSRHFRLRDFLTKGQEGVWPKYVVISPRLLDKLELTIQELERMGHPVENVFVISGFRTPWYNQHGGNPQGRGAMSRHMFGDAADIAIDNTRNGCMDDLNGDGVVDVRDARIIVEAAERVERRYPHLIGGIGIYRPVRGSHCGMVHIDTRGTRARW